MKKDKLLTLLKKIKEINAFDEEVVNVLNQNEDVLTLLASLDTRELKAMIFIIQKYLYTNYDISEIINTLHNSNYYDEALFVLIDANLKELEIALRGIKIMNEAPNKFNAGHGCYILTNKTALEAGIALRGIKIINESPNDFNAKYARSILINKTAIEARIALIGAKIINEAPNDFNAKYARNILTNKTAIEAGIALIGAKIINESPNESSAEHTYFSLIDEAKRIISTTKEDKEKNQVKKISDLLIDELEKEKSEDVEVNKLVKKLTFKSL